MAFEIEVFVEHTSEDTARLFAQRLLAISDIDKVSGKADTSFGKAWKPDQWYELLITLKPYIAGASVYVGKKLLDELIAAIKEYFKEDTTSAQKRRAKIIWGPDGSVLTTVEIEEGEITVKEP